MVRVDHEDGGVLNPDDDTPGDIPEDTAGDANATDENTAGTPSETDAKPVVRKTSPLGRKPKKRKRAAADPDKADPDKADPDKATSEEAASDGAVSDEKTPDEKTPDEKTPDEGSTDAPATEEVSTEEVSTDEVATDEAAADSVSYRDRRVGAQNRRSAREAAAQTRRSAVNASTALRVTALVTGAVVLVAGVVLSILFAVGYQRIDHQRELRAEYAGFARQVVVQMTTLDSENADAMYKLAMEKTSGRAQQVFRDNMKQVTEMIREGDAVTETTVLTEAVSEATDDEGTVLMVVGWESRTKDGSQEPLFQTFRYEVGMTRINGELKVTDLEFVW